MSQRIAGLCSRCIYNPAQTTRFTSQFLIKPLRISHRNVQTQQYQNFAPPSPSSLGAPKRAKYYPRTQKWGRRFFYTALVGGSLYLVDTQFYAASITRSLRTFSTGLITALDYKINFREEPLFGGSIGDLHRRSAERLFNLLRENGGLYLKIGQAIAMQSAVMPPEFQQMFSRMFDDAPQNDWADVEKVIREEFGKSPEEVFGPVMERMARASASVAQVHWARLADGREVAVKVQKREIAHQVGWDLWAFKVVMKVYTKWFDLPLYAVVPYITERLMLETDFENEAANSIKMADFVASEPRLKNRVYIPKVYPDLSTKRIMTAEWIEGVRLWDKETLTAPWVGGRGRGSPGADGTPLGISSSSNTQTTIPQNRTNATKLKPERNAWKGRNQKGGLGLSLQEIMTTMVDLFSCQMFIWGLVHCDPHPGNIFIRRLPNGHSQLVLIDHGLYINMTPKFRHEYSLFWKSLLTFDNKTLSDITLGWGVRSADLFASATLMKPYEGGDASTRGRITTELTGKTRADRHYEMQERMRQGIRDVLADEDKWPRELLFIGRNMRIVQGNNQYLGSPVNRIKMTGTWASRALVDDPHLGWKERAGNWWRHLLFKGVMFGSDVVFWTSKVKQWVGLGQGMEDDMERQLRVIAKDTFGVELQHDVFEG